jgi:integrase
MPDLSRKRERERLKVRREPYWQRLGKGAQLGFRRGSETWVAKFRGRDGKRQYETLGDHIDFDDAKRLAEAWLSRLAGSAARSVKRDTVWAALETYLVDLKRHRRPGAAAEALWRFKVVVYKDPIAELQLESITLDDFLEWRDRLLPGRAPRTVNRYVRAVVAGLNRAKQLGHVANPEAWDLASLQDPVDDDGETAVFLDQDQRRALLASAEPHAADFLRGLELTGARPHELANAKGSDFDGETLRLAHKKGKPPKLRVRRVVLGADGVAFFKKQAKDKLPAAYLFTEDGETPWRTHMWCRRVRSAIAANNALESVKHRIPTEASAYSFRHARISELLQLHAVDPLTVAQQTGTSLAMIEKAYLRFIQSAMKDKLAQLRA